MLTNGQTWIGPALLLALTALGLPCLGGDFASMDKANIDHFVRERDRVLKTLHKSPASVAPRTCLQILAGLEQQYFNSLMQSENDNRPLVEASPMNVSYPNFFKKREDRDAAGIVTKQTILKAAPNGTEWLVNYSEIMKPSNQIRQALEWTYALDTTGKTTCEVRKVTGTILGNTAPLVISDTDCDSFRRTPSSRWSGIVFRRSNSVLSIDSFCFEYYEQFSYRIKEAILEMALKQEKREQEETLNQVFKDSKEGEETKGPKGKAKGKAKKGAREAKDNEEANPSRAKKSEKSKKPKGKGKGRTDPAPDEGGAKE